MLTTVPLDSTPLVLILDNKMLIYIASFKHCTRIV